MKKLITATCLLSLAVPYMHAEDNEYKLDIEFTDGIHISYDVDRIGRITFLPTGNEADRLDIKDILDPDLKIASAYFDSKHYSSNLGEAFVLMAAGKEGQIASPHMYEFTHTITINTYAGYTVNSVDYDSRFPYAYSYYAEFCDGPYDRFKRVAEQLAPILNDERACDLVELKALALLLFNHAAQETVDIFGSIPYFDYKNNKATHPYKFDKGIDIYKSIIDNLDDIISVCENFDSRSESYKALIREIMSNSAGSIKLENPEAIKRYAASLKLRMAMQYQKVDDRTARIWAEEAVAAGVIESRDHECKNIMLQQHPMKTISDLWSDIKANASFVSILSSLKHPLKEYIFNRNKFDLTNTSTGTTIPANTTVTGIRAGVRVYSSQGSDNPYTGYSSVGGDENHTGFNEIDYMTIYLMKWAEVDFLRAEGALRGWNMGAPAEFFYERGIRNAEPSYECETGIYASKVNEYLNLTKPEPYTHIDPLDPACDIESVTKIGVKWNNSDSQETKLEKIITQKYIAVFPNGYIAWNDLRRTGYPRIFPVLNPDKGDGSLEDGDLIRRQRLPGRITSDGLNDIETSGIPALGGPDLMSTRVFWDIDKPNF